MKKIGFKESRESIGNYVSWRRDKVLRNINREKILNDLKGKKVLDAGGGHGALSQVLLEKGAIVKATEIDDFKFKYMKNLFKKEKNIKIFKVKDEILSFKDNEFDVVFLFDMIEHTKNPKKMFAEALKVLKSGGVLYVCFGPYYSISGHHLYDFAKWPIHILPKKNIRKIVYAKKLDGYFNNDYFWSQYESLNKLKISEFQKMTEPLKRIEERFIMKYPPFEINLPFLNFLGPLKDLFTMSFEGIYIKR